MYNVQSSTSFRGLDYSNVMTVDRENFIRKDLSALRILGDNYDIRMTSTYADVPGMRAIDIDVRPLKKGLNFFQKLFRPIGRATFQAELASAEQEGKSSIVQSVEAAIINLGKKLPRRK